MDTDPAARRTPTPISHPGAYTKVQLRAPAARCLSCGVRGQCLPLGLDEGAMHSLDRLFGPPRRLARREVLYRAGEPFTAVHAVRVGTLKTLVLGEDGREQITGYHLAGDVVGVGDYGQPEHTSEAVALEDSEVCSILFTRLDEFAQGEPAMVATLIGLMSRDLRRQQELVLVLGGMSAGERLATFLLNLSARHRARGFSATELVLRMTREEIASFLGLKLETVSRVFSRLQGEGLIHVQGRAVSLLDFSGLRRVAAQAC